LAQVSWVLTPHPPHKQGIPLAPLEERVEMVQAAIQGESGFALSRVDLDRPPPHYAVDTLRLLRGSMPGSELFYLMGGDSLRDLPSWHAPQDFVAACDGIGVMLRPGVEIDLEGLNRRLPGVAEKVRFVTAPLLEISASDIRKRIAQGRPFRYYLHPAVYERIVAQGLYKG
jgi:nicotinate-nucleotide adenylyltransferase